MIVLAVAAATVAAFVASSGYYSLAQPFEKRALGGAALDRGRPTPWQVGAELARTLVLACGYAWLAHAAEMTSLPRGLLLAIALWVSFPVVLLLGSMTWERVPAITAAMHAGDWLVKLLIIAVALGLLH